MKNLKKLGISLIIGLTMILVLCLLMTMAHYFNIISSRSTNIYKIFITLLSLFFSGFYLGRHTPKKGWFEGLKLGLIFIVIFLIVNLGFLNEKFAFKTLFYYMIFL